MKWTVHGERIRPDSERVEWLTIEDLLTESKGDRVGDRLSLTALLWWLTFEYPKAALRR